jgi:exo-beta-1,3-glucanase (GH17 family)
MKRALAALLFSSACAACAAAPVAVRPPQRPLDATLGGRFIGSGIAYGMHRDGQSPQGAQPSREQLAEDLRLLSRRWSFLRTYDASPTVQQVLEIIRDEKLPLVLMLGCWVAPETRPGKGQPPGTGEPHPEGAAANRAELERCVLLANGFPDLVRGVLVGNETQVDWSDHRCGEEVLLRSLKEVRARVRQPVSTADDFNFWNKPHSHRIADAVDFLDVHAYAMWGGAQLADAVRFTQEKLETVRKEHPGRLLVLGEYGWATQRTYHGEQAQLIKGARGEPEQAAFYAAAHAWLDEARITNFWFEAFDENWKGGAEPAEVEKHWGLYRADRTPKQAAQ